MLVIVNLGVGASVAWLASVLNSLNPAVWIDIETKKLTKHDMSPADCPPSDRLRELDRFSGSGGLAGSVHDLCRDQIVLQRRKIVLRIDFTANHRREILDGIAVGRGQGSGHLFGSGPRGSGC